MKRMIIGLIVLMVISVGFFSGCTEQKSTDTDSGVKTDLELFIGSWETGPGDKWTFTESTFYKGNTHYYYEVKSTTDDMTLGEAPLSTEEYTRHGIVFTWITKDRYETHDYSIAGWYTFRFDENDILTMSSSQGYPDNDVELWVLYRMG